MSDDDVYDIDDDELTPKEKLDEELEERYSDMADEFGGPGKERDPLFDEEEAESFFENPEGLSNSQMDDFNRDKTVKQFKGKIMAAYDLESKDDKDISAEAAKVLREVTEQRIEDIGCVTMLPGMNGADEYIFIKAFYLRHKPSQELKAFYTDMQESDTVEAKRILRDYVRG